MATRKTYGRLAVFAGTLVAGGIGLSGTAHALEACDGTTSQSGPGASASSTASCGATSTATTADGFLVQATSNNDDSPDATATAVTSGVFSSTEATNSGSSDSTAGATADGVDLVSVARNYGSPGSSASASSTGVDSTAGALNLETTGIAEANASGVGGVALAGNLPSLELGGPELVARPLKLVRPAAGHATATVRGKNGDAVGPNDFNALAAAVTTGGGTAEATAIGRSITLAVAAEGGRAIAKAKGTGQAVAIAVGDCSVRAVSKGHRSVVKVCYGQGYSAESLSLQDVVGATVLPVISVLDLDRRVLGGGRD